ncbi:MAG: flagellar biosynthesis anti-sigma factor FlgM [Armatimonadetes bacterium]|nr:flagellar biosynthesis anti-sigma factor FlgM [Armatimonadota bacterium]
MKISTEQLEKVKALGGQVTPPESVVDTAVIKLMDADLIKSVVQEVNAMPDRDDMVAELKARLEKGECKPTGEDIADAMIRRSRADRIS